MTVRRPGASRRGAESGRDGRRRRTFVGYNPQAAAAAREEVRRFLGR